VPAIGVQFLDEDPDHLAECLRAFEGDHHVGQRRGHRVLLLLGEDPFHQLDVHERHFFLLNLPD